MPADSDPARCVVIPEIAAASVASGPPLLTKGVAAIRQDSMAAPHRGDPRGGDSPDRGGTHQGRRYRGRSARGPRPRTQASAPSIWPLTTRDASDLSTYPQHHDTPSPHPSPFTAAVFLILRRPRGTCPHAPATENSPLTNGEEPPPRCFSGARGTKVLPAGCLARQGF